MANAEINYQDFEPTPDFREEVGGFIGLIFRDAEIFGDEASGALLKRQIWAIDGVAYIAARFRLRQQPSGEFVDSTRVELIRLSSPDEYGLSDVRIYWYFMDTGALHVANEILTPEEIRAVDEDQGAKERFNDNMKKEFNSGFLRPSGRDYAELLIDVATFQ